MRLGSRVGRNHADDCAENTYTILSVNTGAMEVTDEQYLVSVLSVV